MNNQQHIPVITLDGPSGTGKGTISQLLARKLGWHYLDSGSMFRVLAYAASQAGISLEDEDQLALLAETVKPVFDSREDGVHVMLTGEDISDLIRGEDVAKIASQIAVLPKVRAALSRAQRGLRQLPGLVTDGRDMGTVIFPDAQIKFFLDASSEERARRRYLQLKDKGINVSLDEILKDIEKRDVRDKSRLVAPLEPAFDAIIIDTTSLNIEQTFEQVLKHVNF